MKQGFTLLELSIVLVIIGLIIGGITVGADLIRAAELNSAVSDLNKYKTALYSFRLKYNALPGDIKNAEAYELHLDKSGSENTCITEASVINFNGDGNGKLEDHAHATQVYYSGEIANFFIHLSNADMISQTLERVSSSNSCIATATEGINYPTTELGGLIPLYSNSNNQINLVLGGIAGNSHHYRLDATVEGNSTSIAENDLTPEIAERIDRKIDDSSPFDGTVKVIKYYASVSTGSVRNYGRLNYDDVDNATNCIYNGAYNLSYDEKSCTLAIEYR